MQVIDAEVRGRLSYLGASQPLPPMESPYDGFDRLFAGGGRRRRPARPGRCRRSTRGPNGCASSARACSISWAQELGTRAGLGGRRRPRPPGRPPGIGAGHRAPAAPLAGADRRPGASAGRLPAIPTPGARMDVAAPANLPAVGRLQMDLAAAALRLRPDPGDHLAVDPRREQPELPVPRRHRPAPRHVPRRRQRRRRPGEPDQDQRLVRRAVEVPAGPAGLATGRAARTLLDNTRGAVGERGGQGQQPRPPRPAVPAGRRRGGRLRTGRFVDYLAGGGRGQPHNNLLVSLANADGPARHALRRPRPLHRPAART